MTFSLQDMAPEAVSRWLSGQRRSVRHIVQIFCVGLPVLSILTVATARHRPNFIINTAYTAKVWPWAALLGACLCLPFAVMILRDRGPKPVRRELRMFEALLMVSLGAGSLHVVVGQTTPLVAAMIAGHSVAMERHIEGAIIGGPRSCPVAVKVNDPVFPVFCNPPWEIQHNGTDVQSIHISGYGTGLGIFWTSIQPSQ